MATSKRAGIIVGVIMFVIVVSGLYAIIYAAPRIEGIGIKTDVVQYDELPIADTVNALFVRDETLYTAAYSGSPEYMVAAGTKVRAGTQVVYIDPSGLPDAVQVTADEPDQYAEQASYGTAEGEDTPEIQESPINSIMRTAGNDAVVSEGGVTPFTAIVSYYGDGWEKRITPDNILNLPKSIFDRVPAEAVDLSRRYVLAGEPVYRITNNNLWHVAFWVENADKTVIDKYKPGRSLTLDMGTTKVRAQVESAETRGRDVLIVLSSDMYYKDLDKYRLNEISVVFSQVSGAVIEKQDVKLKSGMAGVYVKQQSGTFKWVPVKILKESGNRYLIAETYFEDESGKRIQTIRYYDEIMKDPAGQGF